jgi:hypothetical protein
MTAVAQRHWGHASPSPVHQQYLEALQKANRIRSQRAQLKVDIKEGRETVYGHLMSPPEYIKTMKVWDLCLAKNRVGRVMLNKIFTQKRISPAKTVGELTLRQRQELAKIFG